MYIISIRTKEKMVILSCESSMVLAIANILENSKDIINFKVSNSCCTGLLPIHFGADGFEKWVETNHPIYK